jgi:hypothetical protein
MRNALEIRSQFDKVVQAQNQVKHDTLEDTDLAVGHLISPVHQISSHVDKRQVCKSPLHPKNAWLLAPHGTCP